MHRSSSYKPLQKYNKSIAMYFAEFGEKKENIKKSDLVIVLGNEMIEGTISEVNDMYRRGIIANDAAIILTGATSTLNAGERCECERMYECAVEMYEMPQELFHRDNRATNTYQNFLYSKAIIEKIGNPDSFSSILCIGKVFLMSRASMYAAKLNIRAKKYSIMVQLIRREKISERIAGGSRRMLLTG